MSGWNRELIRSCDLMTFSLSWYSFWMSDLVFGCPGAIRYGWHVVPTPEPTKNGDPQIEMVKKNANFTETIQNICTRFALSHLKRKKEKEKKSVLLNVCLFGSCFRTLAVNLVSDPSNLPHLKMVPGFDFHSLEYSISARLKNFTSHSTSFLTQQFRVAKQIHFLLRFKHAKINIEEYDYYYQSIGINYTKNKSYSEHTCRSVVAKWNRFVLTTVSKPHNQQLSQPIQPSWWNFCVGQPLQDETVLY